MRRCGYWTVDAPSADLSAAVAAVAAVVGSGAVLPPTSAETSRLVESQPEERDSALLDIFVEEATEVAAGIRANYAELTAHHARRDVLVDIRRAFHTEGQWSNGRPDRSGRGRVAR